MAGSNQNQGKQAAKNRGRSVSPTRPAGGRQMSTLLTWGIVGLVVVVIAALLIVKATSGSNKTTQGTSTSGFQAASASLTAKLTQIPTSVFDKVGISSPNVPINPPTLISGEPALSFKGGSVTTPGFFYSGAEYCPYCAAERWPAIIALSRFGAISNLGLASSSSTDVYPSTPTFTFSQVGWKSKLLALRAVESLGEDGKTVVMTPTKQDNYLVRKYDTTKYIPATQPGAIPFMSINNRGLLSGASYSPSVLSGLSRDQIASGLSDPTSPVTQAIIATANYITAVICSQTKNAPSNVCSSKGVLAASTALKLK